MIDNENIIKDGVVVKCPICNKVLFIMDKKAKGEIAIKCLRCKNISKIDLYRANNHELKSQEI